MNKKNLDDLYDLLIDCVESFYFLNTWFDFKVNNNKINVHKINHFADIMESSVKFYFTMSIRKLFSMQPKDISFNYFKEYIQGNTDLVSKIDLLYKNVIISDLKTISNKVYGHLDENEELRPPAFPSMDKMRDIIVEIKKLYNDLSIHFKNSKLVLDGFELDIKNECDEVFQKLFL